MSLKSILLKKFRSSDIGPHTFL